MSDILGVLDDDAGPPPIQLITLGEEFGRRGARQVVAITRVALTLASEADVQACADALKASDALLAQKPEAERLYDWQIALRYGHRIVFGVAWYDRDFFESRKDAYTSAHHTGLFKKFGAAPRDLQVQHFVARD